MADASADRHRFVFDDERLGERGAEFRGDRLGILASLHLMQDHRELVSGQSGHGIRCADDPAETLGHRLQKLIPSGVPQRVVDCLEAVEI